MNTKKSQKKKKSSVRHTRAIQRDRRLRPPTSPPDAQTQARLEELLRPAIAQQQGLYQALGLRHRVLSLSVMVAVVVSMIWRQVGSGGTEIARLLATEGLLWVPILVVSQQAISQRLRTFPPQLFLEVLRSLLPVVQARWQVRSRPLAPALQWAQARYSAVLTVDGSTLDALMRKVGLLREAERHPLAGKMLTLLDLCSRLPRHIWFDEEPQAHDQRFWPQILDALPKGALLLIDRGFTNFEIFLRLQQVTFIMPAKANLAFTLKYCYWATPTLRDYLVWVGQGKRRQLLRRVQVKHGRVWYTYLTHELDPALLPPEAIVALYLQRWRIEDAFHVVKRLLGLAFFWVGSQYGVQLQLWATWLLYAVLVDLTDDVAEALNRPFDDISMEMVHRSLYYFAQALQRGEADDLVAFLAANARFLGLIKRHRKRSSRRLLDLTDPPDP